MLTQEEFENYDVSKFNNDRELREFIHKFIEAHPEITHLNLDKWDVSNIKDKFEDMLEDPDLSESFEDILSSFNESWINRVYRELLKSYASFIADNVRRAKRCSYMFRDCYKLESKW